MVADPAFAPANGAPFTIHTRWIETEFNNTIPAFDLSQGATATDDAGSRQSVIVEVGGKRLEVTLPESFALSNGSASNSSKKAKKAGRNRSAGPAAANGNDLTSPMQGTIVKVAVADHEDGATAHRAPCRHGDRLERSSWGYRLRRRGAGKHRRLNSNKTEQQQGSTATRLNSNTKQH